MLKYLLILLAYFLTLINAQPGPLTFTLGAVSKIEDFLPHSGYYPDGHMSVLKVNSNEYHAYWSEFENFRTISNTNDLRYHVGKMNPNRKIFGGRKNDDGSGSSETSWSDGGAWLMGIHKLIDGRLLALVHAESHWYPRDPAYTAYKSVGLAYSSDNGLTWNTSDSYRVLTPPYAKPDKPVWSGNGDGALVWDPFYQRYLCFYTASRFPLNNPLLSQTESPKLSLASTSEPTALPTTWKKYNGTHFSQPGLGGFDTPLKNLDTIPGANPSVHFNIYLNRWIIVWYKWNPRYIYISSSFDAINWGKPQILINDSDDLQYPNIIGETHDLGGKTVRIYYARMLPNSGKREILTREITFEI